MSVVFGCGMCWLSPFVCCSLFVLCCLLVGLAVVDLPFCVLMCVACSLWSVCCLLFAVLLCVGCRLVFIVCGLL